MLSEAVLLFAFSSEDKMAAEIAEVANQFVSRFCNVLFNDTGNIFVSPWSLYNALSMTHIGARKNTERQLSQLLGYEDWENLAKRRRPNDDNSINSSMKKLIESLMRIKCSGTDFTTSSNMWIQEGFKITNEFTQVLTEFFLSTPGLVNFSESPEKASEVINSCVEKQTNGKIENLIPPGAITDITKLVLTNAVYFKGSWLHEFKKSATKILPFNVTDETVVNTEMMTMKAVNFIRYNETKDYQALGLPYEGGRLVMTIVLPRNPNGIMPLIENALKDSSLLRRWIKAPHSSAPIKIFIPKFKVTFFKELNEALCFLGATDMFDENMADFSGISVQEQLMVTSVVQKAFIAVDEKGTEAAAATAVTFAPRCALPMEPESPILFKADHPFLFFISDSETNLVLFAGKLENPNC